MVTLIINGHKVKVTAKPLNPPANQPYEVRIPGFEKREYQAPSPKGTHYVKHPLTQQASQLIKPVVKDNPFLVSNPYPEYEGNENIESLRMPKIVSDGPYQPQPLYQPPMTQQFNPNSFYNQHSQYRMTQMQPVVMMMMPSEMMMPQQMHSMKPSLSEPKFFMQNLNMTHRQNFENLSSQNRQMRMAGEAVINLGKSPQVYQYDQYESNSDPQYNYSKPPMIMTYTPQMMPSRGELYSNPVPYQFQKGSSTMTHSMERNYWGDRSYSAQNPGAEDRSKTVSPGKDGFKPYSYKDYKEMKNRIPTKLGGLGANINTEEWQKRKEKMEKMAAFSQEVKHYNSQKNLITTSTKKYKDETREKSKREIANEFAKNIPKPKIKSVEDIIIPVQARIRQENYYEQDDYMSNDLEMLEKKHRNYLNQVEKIK